MKQPVKLQKRHFELIAKIIGTMSVSQPYMRSGVAYHFAVQLKQTNPQYDIARFMRACDENYHGS